MKHFFSALATASLLYVGTIGASTAAPLALATDGDSEEQPPANNPLADDREVSAYCRFSTKLPWACMSEQEKATASAAVGGLGIATGFPLVIQSSEMLAADERLRTWNVTYRGAPPNVEVVFPPGYGDFYGRLLPKCTAWAIQNIVPDRERRKREFQGCPHYTFTPAIIYDLLPKRRAGKCGEPDTVAAAERTDDDKLSLDGETSLKGAAAEEGLECSDIELPGQHSEMSGADF